MGPTWVLSAPDWPHVGPMNLLSGKCFHLWVMMTVPQNIVHYIEKPFLCVSVMSVLLFCDHIFDFSGYMELHSRDTATDLYIPMISPEFHASQNYCFSFQYEIWMSEFTKQPQGLPKLEIYISETSHAFSGRRIWKSNGTGDGLVQIPISARHQGTSRISFVGITNNRVTARIKVANVELSQGKCLSLNCDNSMCADESYDSDSQCEWVLC